MTTEESKSATGVALREASVLLRGTAVAVDLSLAVTFAALGFALISWFTPLDGNGAKIPMLVVVLAALLYAGWGRNYLPSPGRMVFGLRTARLPGPFPGAYGRLITVHASASADSSTTATVSALGVIAMATLVAGLCMAIALANTNVFRLAADYVAKTLPLQSRYGAPPVLSALPRALLVGKTRAYVQIGTRWGERHGMLDVHLHRVGKRWEVTGAYEAQPGSLANYALAAAEEDIPPLPDTR